MSRRPASILSAAALVLALCADAAVAQDRGDELRRAASAGDVAKVRALLDAGADPNAGNRYGATALSFACDKGHAEVVKLLLERGARVDVKDTFYNSTPVVWAAMKGHAEVLRALLEKGADAPTALSTAVMSGHPAAVKVVLDRGGLPADALTESLVAAERSEEPAGKEIAALLKAAGAQPPPPPAQIAPEVLAGHVGTYRSQEGFAGTIALKDGKLTAAFEGGGTLTLAPVDATTFRAEEFPAVKFAFDPAAGTLVVEQPGRTFNLKKEAAGASAPKGEQP